jgi:hypothetical protein
MAHGEGKLSLSGALVQEQVGNSVDTAGGAVHPPSAERRIATMIATSRLAITSESERRAPTPTVAAAQQCPALLRVGACAAETLASHRIRTGAFPAIATVGHAFQRW